MEWHERTKLEYEIQERLGHPHFIIHSHELENGNIVITDLVKLEVIRIKG